MLRGETVHSCLPWDIPWWQAEYAVFFTIFYASVVLIFIGLGAAFIKTVRQLCVRRKTAPHQD